jgi:hypothetical protein
MQKNEAAAKQMTRTKEQTERAWRRRVDALQHDVARAQSVRRP